MTRMKPADLVPAVGYIRMSTDMQKDSPERQRSEIVAMAEREGYSILRWYEDHGKTGTTSKNRPAFQRLMADTAKGDFQAVLLYEQSRFSREGAFEAMAHWKILMDAGVSLVTVQRGEMRFNNIADLIGSLIGQDQAKNESVTLAKRTMSGKRLKAKEGIHMGPTPFGFDREIVDDTGTVVKRLTCRDRFHRPKAWRSRLVPAADPNETDAIKYAFDSIIAGVSLNQIAAEFNRRGLKTTRGMPFRACWIRKMIRNPVYAGIAQYGKVRTAKLVDRSPDDGLILVANAHQPIISPAVAKAANDTLDAIFRNAGDTGEKGRYPLTGLVICGHCGRKMKCRTHQSYKYTTEGVHRQYNCKPRYPGLRECDFHPCISADVLEAMVLRIVARHYLCDENFEMIREIGRRSMSGADVQSVDDVQLQEVRSNIRTAQKNLALAKPGHFQAISEVLDELLEKEATLVERVAKGRKNAAKIADFPVDTLEELRLLRDNLHLAERHSLAVALRGTIKSVTVFKQHEQSSSGVLLHQFYGTVEFIPEILPTPVAFSDPDLFPDRPYLKVAEFVASAGRPVRTAEIVESLKVHATTAIVFAKRAAAHGLLKIDRPGVFSPIAQ